MMSPSCDRDTHAVKLPARDPHRLGADHRRLAPAAGHDGGVADQAAAGGQDALGGDHAVHVLRGGLVAAQDDPLAARRRPRRRRRREDDLGPTAAPGEAARPLARRGGRCPANCGCSTWSRCSRADAQHGLLPADLPAPLLGHVDGHAQRGRARSACPPGSAASTACPARW